MVYSTYFGYESVYGEAIAVDSAGNAYLTGYTVSGGLPVTSAVQPVYAGGADAFVAKLNPSGSAWIYMTYLGGSNDEIGYGISVDSLGNAYVVGETRSSNFPIMNAKQPALAGSLNAFVSKLGPSGNTLVFSTYLGAGTTSGRGIATDGSGRTYVTGYTNSTTFPTLNAAQPALVGSQDAFVTAYDSTGNNYLYSTYLGGSSTDTGLGIAVDGSGNVFVTGQTLSADFPSVAAFQPSAPDTGTLFRSSDFAGNWSPTSVTATGGPVSSIAVDPTNSQTIYAAAEQIYRSSDGGATWSVLLGSPAVVTLAADPINPCTLYGGYNSGSSFPAYSAKTSTDCGLTWSSFGPFGMVNVRSIVVAPGFPSVYMTGTTLVANSFPPPLYVSNSSICRLTAASSWACLVGIGSNPIVALDPSNSCTSYLGTDGGKVYQNLSCSLMSAASYAQLGPNLSGNVRSLATHPTDHVTVYAGTDGGGIYKFVASPSPVWVSLATLDGSVAVVTIDRSNPNILYAGTSAGSVYKSTNGGSSWDRTSFAASAVNTITANSASVLAGSSGASDAFVSKFGPSGAMVFSTFHGGHFADQGNAIAIDASGSAYVTGFTSSRDYPVTSGVLQNALAGDTDGFVAKITPSLSQTITFGPLVDQVFGKAPFSISATATSGLPVSFNSQTTPVCTVSGGTVTLVAVGTCTVQATQAGNTNYAAAAPVTRSFQVTWTLCDINQDGSTNGVDVQRITSESLGVTLATHDLTQDGVVNVVDVQIVINATLGLGCTDVSGSNLVASVK